MSLTEIQGDVSALYNRFAPTPYQPEQKYTEDTERQVHASAQQIADKTPQLSLEEVEIARKLVKQLRWVSRRDPKVAPGKSPLNHYGLGILLFATEKQLLKRELDLWVASHPIDGKKYQIAAEKIADVFAREATALDLPGLDLEDLPEGLGVCIDLEEIYLAKNRLRTFPTSLKKCKYLKILSAPENRLESLPDTLGKCTRLQTLNLGKNCLTALPDLSRCTNLKHLTLASNQLARLSDRVSQWVMLEYLDLRDNPSLEALPSSLGELSELSSFFVSEQLQTAQAPIVLQIACAHSALTSFALGILAWRYPNIQGFVNGMRIYNDAKAFFIGKLDWSCQKLSSVPDCIGLCRRLRKLDLSHNKLTKLAESLGLCTALRVLMLGSNKLSALPNLRGCTQLKDLYLRSNQFSALPDYLPTLPKLKFIEVGDNPELKDLPETFSMRYIDILIYDTQISYDRLHALQKTAKRAEAAGDGVSKGRAT